MDYESAALTAELRAPSLIRKKIAQFCENHTRILRQTCVVISVHFAAFFFDVTFSIAW